MKITVTFESEIANAAMFLARLTQDGPNDHGMQSAVIKADKKHDAVFDAPVQRLSDFELWINAKVPQGSGISKIKVK